MIKTFVFLFVVLAGLANMAHAQTDVVVFENGDRLTGDIKSLERGQLRIETDQTGTINVHWSRVAFVSSDQNIQVEMDNGVRYFGSIAMGDKNHAVIVNAKSGPIELDGTQIVTMNPIDTAGISALDLEVAIGYNFTKASNVEQFNFSVDAGYRTRERILSAEFSSNFTDSDSNDASQRTTLGLNYTRLRANRWLNDGSLGFEQNDELDLTLRSTLGSGIGRILRQSDHAMLVVRGGLQVSNEDLISTDEDVQSLEAYITGSWDWYKYDTPELDLSTNLEVIPSLTESGRVRVEFDTKVKWEIFEDLFWVLDFYSSYDSQSQADGSSTSDHGVNTSVSYKF